MQILPVRGGGEGEEYGRMRREEEEGMCGLCMGKSFLCPCQKKCQTSRPPPRYTVTPAQQPDNASPVGDTGPPDRLIAGQTDGFCCPCVPKRGEGDIVARLGSISLPIWHP